MRAFFMAIVTLPLTYQLANGQTADASQVMADLNQIATNVNAGALAVDGTATSSANQPMGGFHHTGVGNGVVRTDYAAMGQVQDGNINWIAAAGTADALTALYSPAVTALIDGQIAFIRATATNATTTPTFSPNSLTARVITKAGGTAVAAAEWVSAQELILRYNLANTRWELLNPIKISPASIGTGTVSSALTFSAPITMSAASIIEAKGAAVTAAATTNIWATDGNTIHITGNTGITSLSTAPQAGAWKKIIFDGTPLMTHSANLSLNNNGSNIQIAAGDFGLAYADTTTQINLFIVRKSGAAIAVGTGSIVAQSLDGAQTAGPPIFGLRAFCVVNPSTGGTYTPTLPSGNVTSIAKNGTGDFTLTFITQMPTVEYAFSVGQVTPALTLGTGQTLTSPMYEVLSYVQGSIRLQFYSYVGSTNTPSASDPTRFSLMVTC